MKRIISAAIIFFFLFLFVFSSPVFAYEYFKDYDVKIRINSDSSINVTEKITANVENIEIKRGIMRAIPVQYQDTKGRTVRVGLNVLGVKLDGKDIRWEVNDDGRYKVIRIGDPNVILSPGLRTFAIEYESTKQIGFYENYDELYWNVTGNQWSFPIKHASCCVSLPGKTSGQGFNSIEWYVGAYGEKGLKQDAKRGNDGSVSTARSLGIGEGLTVVYTWPKGLVTPPPPPKTDNASAQTLIGLAVLLLTSGWFFFSWNKWGKDKFKKAVIPIFTPPASASPAYLRYARDLYSKPDNTSLAASILQLAVTGLITIEEEKGEVGLFGKSKGTFVLHRTDKKQLEEMTQEEFALISHLFPGTSKKLRLEKAQSSKAQDAFLSLHRNIKWEGRELFSSNKDKCIIGVLIYVLGTAALYPFSGEFPINMLACVATSICVLLLGMRTPKKLPYFPSQKAKQLLSHLLPSIAYSMPFCLIILSFLYSSRDYLEEEGLSFVPIFSFLLSAFILSAMRFLMYARTQKGSEMQAAAEGLALYMKTAEKERLEMFNPPEETPELFEKLLPYALALDAAKTWANRFEKILAKNNYTPSWYTGPDPFIFAYGSGFGRFSSDIVSSVADSLVSKTTTLSPGSSSGFGGGGFSGGGGGGGGGKGW